MPVAKLATARDELLTKRSCSLPVVGFLFSPLYLPQPCSPLSLIIAGAGTSLQLSGHPSSPENL